MGTIAKVAFCLALTTLDITSLSATKLVFTFEAAGPGGNVEYGSHDPQGFPPLLRDGFVIDVQPSGGIHGALHWHELDSLSNIKVPGRPFDKRGVLWRDSLTEQDPLFFASAVPGSLFSLDGLVVGASTADGSLTTAVRVSAFLMGVPLSSVILATPSHGYVTYSGGDLGTLAGLFMDRLEFLGLSTSSVSYYLLDDVVLTVEEDGDQDGVPDCSDDCPNSDLRATVVIQDCDSGVTNTLLEFGCTVSDQIELCVGESGNHGEFVSCVGGLTNSLKTDGILDSREKGAIQRCAARSEVPVTLQ